MSFFKKKIQLSEEELIIQDIIKGMLINKDLIIDVNPDDMSYMLSDLKKDYYIDVDSIGIKIKNHNFSIDRKLSGDVIDLYKSIIKAETVERRTTRKNIIFNNSIDLLNRIKQNVGNGKENSL